MTVDTFQVGDKVKLVELDAGYHEQLDEPRDIEIMKRLVGSVGVLEEDEYTEDRGEFDVFLVAFNLEGETYSLDFLRKELKKV